jgi:formylglycine-generating enzyme required for sulfatase activity
LRAGSWQILGSDATDNIVFDAQKNGYRLPTIREWERAARGASSSQGYSFSGSNDLNSVAWYVANAGGATHAVGTKLANELGLYDMSGNAMEWCWDRIGIARYARGGTWNSSQNEYLSTSQHGNWLPSVDNFWDNQGDFGFRIVRNADLKISLSGTMPEANLDQAYLGYTFTASGTTGLKSWSVSSGTLPPGMTFNATTALLSGIPNTTGKFKFTIKVSSAGLSDEVEVELDVSDTQLKYQEMVTIYGGTLPVESGLAGQSLLDYQIGKFEVTWSEWLLVRNYAIANGYDLTSVGNGTDSFYPVRQVSWYDVLKWCNAKSEMEGLEPVYYTVNGTYKTGQVTPTQGTLANGYRLPIEAEWEWAARGGILSQGYAYSGSNDLNAVAWYSANSGNATHQVGTKNANELGLFDMTGNVSEWCWDLFSTQSSARRLRGGGYGSNSTISGVSYRSNATPNIVSTGRGFRLARTAPISFSYTGKYRNWVVPENVTQIYFELKGATGGTASGGQWTVYGGLGASVSGVLRVTPGETLYFFVGGAGDDCKNQSIVNGGFNGGGAGVTNSGSGGGGATDIRMGGIDIANRVVVAAGGGGANSILGYHGGGGNGGGGAGLFTIQGAVGGSGAKGGGGGGYLGGNSEFSSRAYGGSNYADPQKTWDIENINGGFSANGTKSDGSATIFY